MCECACHSRDGKCSLEWNKTISLVHEHLNTDVVIPCIIDDIFIINISTVLHV